MDNKIHIYPKHPYNNIAVLLYFFPFIVFIVTLLIFTTLFNNL